MPLLENAFSGMSASSANATASGSMRPSSDGCRRHAATRKNAKAIARRIAPFTRTRTSVVSRASSCPGATACATSSVSFPAQKMNEPRRRARRCRGDVECVQPLLLRDAIADRRHELVAPAARRTPRPSPRRAACRASPPRTAPCRTACAVRPPEAFVESGGTTSLPPHANGTPALVEHDSLLRRRRGHRAELARTPRARCATHRARDAPCSAARSRDLAIAR